MVKNFSKPKKGPRTAFAFPRLHKAVEDAVSQNISATWVRKSNNDRTADKEYTTHVVGKFRCMNEACGKGGWSSGKVAILIRGYEGNGYNAVVFNQRCKTCNTLGTLTLDEKSYVDRIAYRIQRWAGVEMEQPYYASKESLPHKQELCEGCKRGVCRQTSDWEYN